jgi:two-component system response regulator NreC
LSKIRIVLCDDHQIIRQGLRALLKTNPDFEVVGESADGFDLVNLVDKILPNVVVTDIAMPNMNGMEATKQIRKRHPQTQVIILSQHAASSYVIGSLRNGALGYILKSDDYMDIAEAIQDVMRGKRHLSTQVLDTVINFAMTDNEIFVEPRNLLSDREREVLQLIAEGHTSQQIADKLSISIRTAEKHRANMKEKLDINTHADLVHFAIQQGIVSLKQLGQCVEVQAAQI